ncbi:MAG: hypothetical protein QM802_19815 [Agriterribacter sp.]
MLTPIEAYWKLESHLKKNKPELYEIFCTGNNLQISHSYKIVTYTDKSYYSDEQWQEVVKDWETIKEQNGLKY